MKIKQCKYVILINEDLRSKHEIPVINKEELNSVNYDSACFQRQILKKEKTNL